MGKIKVKELMGILSNMDESTEVPDSVVNLVRSKIKTEQLLGSTIHITVDWSAHIRELIDNDFDLEDLESYIAEASSVEEGIKDWLTDRGDVLYDILWENFSLNVK